MRSWGREGGEDCWERVKGEGLTCVAGCLGEGSGFGGWVFVLGSRVFFGEVG